LELEFLEDRTLSKKVETIMDRMRGLQEDLEKHFEARRAGFEYELHGFKVRFTHEIEQMHRSLRTTLGSYVKGARLSVILTAPVIYSVILPFLILDVFVSTYQAICFRVYGIPRVCRSDYIALDRHHLQYLNGIEKLNCAYCSYGNGLLAYASEIASRTEQFWCPIKHARRIDGTHPRYPLFFDYGDGHAYKEGLKDMRKGLVDDVNRSE